MGMVSDDTIAASGSLADWGPVRLRPEPAGPAFPAEVLPAAVARLADEVAQAVGCDPALVAAPALAVAGGVIGRSVRLVIAPERAASAAVYLACVVPAGDEGAAALRVLLEPVRQIQADLAIKVRPRRLRCEEERKCLSFQATVPQDAICKAVPMPHIPRVLAEEMTVPALLRRSETTHGLLGVYDELAPLMFGAGLAGRARDVAALRRAWTGATVFVPRRYDPERPPRAVRNPQLSLVGFLALERVPWGGLLPDRWLFVCPDRGTKLALARRRPVSHSARGAWAELVQRLWERALDTSGDGSPRPHYLGFERDAAEAFSRWADRYAAEAEDLLFPEAWRAPHATLGAYAGRLALVLHLMDLAASGRSGQVRPPEVGVSAVEGAWSLVRYFAAQALRVRDRLANERSDLMPEGARMILNWIRRHPGERHVREGNLTQWYPPSRGYPRCQFVDGFAWLTHRGALRPVPVPAADTGRKLSPTWEIHPQLRAEVGFA
jgi:hypothetical protein